MHSQYLFVDPSKLSKAVRDHFADIGSGRGRLDVDLVIYATLNALADTDLSVIARDYTDFFPFLEDFNAGQGRC